MSELKRWPSDRIVSAWRLSNGMRVDVKRLAAAGVPATVIDELTEQLDLFDIALGQAHEIAEALERDCGRKHMAFGDAVESILARYADGRQ